MKQIIRCPNCEEKGIKQNLAQILPNGLVAILRRGRDKYAEYTIIGGSKIYIICGVCGSIVYIQKK